ncbi:hypothetical protein [Actinomadura macrotermitis]|uniref:hypothetical protein n=1 Tax=Actinomadura macrotermitis TaxID=2585200 RepID=UPI0012972932|nr:hypothetical protein [Actinomadura macrotermitis]
MSIDAGTVRVLLAHRKRQAAEKLEAGESRRGAGKIEDGHVFVSGRVLPIPPTRPHPS